MDRQESIWTRRNNVTNLSLSTPSQSDNSTTPRDFSSLARRNGTTSSHGRSNAFGATTPGGTLTSPTSAGGANQFGLGSGAFASFGSAKTPKSQGNPFEQAMGAVGAKTPSSEKTAKEAMRSTAGKPSMGSISETSAQQASAASTHPLRDTWVFWYRPPITKANGYIEYDKTLHAMMSVKTVEEFWLAYSHLKRPSSLPTVSDYHFFKKGIRPIWEDDENKLGGKWVLRLKKGVADRYYEDLLMACVGDQFGDEADELCGVVLSMRNGEDVLSIWTRSTGQKVLKIRETMRRVLNCPPETRIEFKSHDASMQQRSAIDEMRREKAAQNHHSDKRTHNNNNKNRQLQDEQQRS
ncbi:translation initiation factor eIF4e [Daldinia loculata]|uniref:translation initiation factor eIF4e n=1 Tax=Daldinia loculata TaxID=103429 RepID=UPI0020C27231|nr:translation initiation factor eIF4e [Daldinia loculata]KAI1643138.1 translation initiation factor eIF4e [Daldinia loculata]KAI2784603.1 translation initiation factor eIF4e [Daldinia loculata]